MGILIVIRKFGGVVYPSDEIKQLDFDLLIISIAEHGDVIKKALLEEYGVPENKIRIFQSIDKRV